MPKLIVKQDVETSSWQDNIAGQLKYILPVMLLLIAGLVFFLMKPAPDDLNLDAATNPEAQAQYRVQHASLMRMDDAYTSLADTKTESYQNNLSLVDQVETILRHLEDMDSTVDLLGVPQEQSDVLLKKHQFQKDYWQAKLHFRQLRLNRYSSDNPSVTKEALRDAVGKAIDAREVTPDASSVDTNLPEGFCAFGDDSCKPGVGENVSVDAEQDLTPDVDLTMKPPAGGSRFIAKPPSGADLPEGFCALGDDSCKVGDTSNQTVEQGQSDQDVTDADMMMKPPAGGSRFLAAPPPGADLPEGFCAFGDDSCKPGAGVEAQSAVPESIEKK